MIARLLLHADTPLHQVAREAANLRFDLLLVASHPRAGVDIAVKLRGNALELIGTCYLEPEAA